MKIEYLRNSIYWVKQSIGFRCQVSGVRKESRWNLIWNT